jgi:hypothetical protein
MLHEGLSVNKVFQFNAEADPKECNYAAIEVILARLWKAKY